MIHVVLIDTNTELQEAVVEYVGTLYVTELLYLNHIRDNLYLINSEYLADIDTCTWYE